MLDFLLNLADLDLSKNPTLINIIKIALLLSTLVFVFFSNSQKLQITNQYVFGGDFNDSQLDAVMINNKTIIGEDSYSDASGDKISANYGGSDLWIISLYNNNVLECQKSYGGSSDDLLYKL